MPPSAASHDLRQPLHAQSLFVELLEARLVDPEHRAFISRIQASGRALTGLLDALLELSRLDSRALKVQPTHFALGTLFEELRTSGRSLLFKPVPPGKLRAALSALLT